ncbi:MAG: hypothetical protein L3J52_10425, partial [Proteobacteria bacterium]|nr:hypothetical protein [Pseudomonadota bacterium]
MLKSPMNFKGPAGQLKQFFSEKLMFAASKLLFSGNLHYWKHSKQTEIINATIEDKNKLYRLSISWPLGDPLGSCACGEAKPCIHLAALALESKTRLDQLPPFTRKIHDVKDTRGAFAMWLGRQQHDPYPNMARHRLVYILDRHETDQGFVMSLHKAYLSQDEKYQIKSPVDSFLLQQQPLPKFVCLADERIL